MDDDTKHSNEEGSTAPGDSKELIPKPEILDSELPSETMRERPHRDSVPSLPETSVRETLIGMGFSPSRVDQAMKENGEKNLDLLLDTLSNPVPSLPETSVRETLIAMGFSPARVDQAMKENGEENIDRLLDTLSNSVPSLPETSVRETLIRMGSSPSRVDQAIKEHGEEDLEVLLEALSSDSSESTDSLESILESMFGDEDSSGPPNFSPSVSRKEDFNDESLFGTTEKIHRLCEMGFSENEVSLAIERLGSEATIQDLAGSICENQIGGHNLDNAKLSFMASSSSHSQSAKNHPEKNISLDTISNSTNIIPSKNYKGKRPIEEYDDDYPATASRRRPKHGDERDTTQRRPQHGDEPDTKTRPHHGDEPDTIDDED